MPEAVIGTLLKLATEDKSVISLGPGEPDYETPKPILTYLKKVLHKGTHYSSPSGRADLKRAILRKLQKDNKIRASEGQLLVTCGSQEAIFASLLTALDPADQVILPDPGYLGYLPAIELVEGVPVHVRLLEEEGFEINPDRIREAIEPKKTKVLFLNTPANPTGNVLSRTTLEAVADIAVEHDLYVFCDEAYEKLVYDATHVSFASLNGMEEYAVTFQTFSKSYAMAGFRLGYVVGPEPFIQAVTKASHYLTLCPPHPSQLAGLKALSLPQRYIEAMRQGYDQRRRVIVSRLNEMGLRTVEPKGAFYTFSNIQDLMASSSAFASSLLKKAKVAVVPGVEFGKFGEGYIRCSYATKLPLIVKAMNRLEKFVRTLRR